MTARPSVRRTERSARQNVRKLILPEVDGFAEPSAETDRAHLLALLTRRDLAWRAGAEHTADSITDELIDAVWGPSVA